MIGSDKKDEHVATITCVSMQYHTFTLIIHIHTFIPKIIIVWYYCFTVSSTEGLYVLQP